MLQFEHVIREKTEAAKQLFRKYTTCLLNFKRFQGTNNKVYCHVVSEYSSAVCQQYICILFTPSISLDAVPTCIIKILVFPWILRITSLKSKHLLTSSSFVPTGLLLHAAVLFKVTLDTTHKSVPGFLWCDGLSIVINNFLHEQRDKPSLISSTLQRGSANQIFHSLSGWLLIANFVLSFLFPSFKYS